MSATENLVDSLEYYMEDLVDSFEEFVKKSLVLISVALGSVLIMAMYVLKLFADRTTYRNALEGSARVSARSRSREISPDNSAVFNRVNKKRDSKNHLTVPSTNTSTCSASAKRVDGSASRSSYEEKILREIGFSTCSKPCNTSKQCIISKHTGSKTVIPSNNLPNCAAKIHKSKPRPCTKYVGTRTSCCSICCEDTDRR